MTAPARLEWLIQQVWREELDSRVVVSARPVAGHRVVETYLVAPSLERARFLIPAANHRLAAASLSAYSRLRSPRTRWAKEAAALAMRSGLGGRAIRDRLYVCVREDVTDDELADLLVLEHVARALGRPKLHAAMGVNELAPNRKPTIQLFEPDGEPAGFLKIGSTPLTRKLVEREVSSLTTLEGTQLDEPRRPRLLLGGDWQDVALLVTSPLPADTRLQDPATRPAPRLDVAVNESAGPTTRAALADSPYWHRIRERVTAVADDVSSDEAAVAADFLAAVERRASGLEFTFGLCHGDWSYWNLGWSGPVCWVWDWEHVILDGPLGLDAAHYGFQRAFLGAMLPVADAVEAGERAGAEHLTALGLGPQAQRVIVDVHLLELYLRAVDMHRLGAGWNDRFHAPAVATLRRRT